MAILIWKRPSTESDREGKTQLSMKYIVQNELTYIMGIKEIDYWDQARTTLIYDIGAAKLRVPIKEGYTSTPILLVVIEEFPTNKTLDPIDFAKSEWANDI